MNHYQIPFSAKFLRGKRLIKFAASFLGLLLTTGAVAQQQFPSSVIFNQTAQNKITSLNGKWQMIVDPYETGFYNYRFQESETGYFKNQKGKPSDLIEYSFDHDNTLYVPGDWNSQQERLMLYEGTIWYKKDFRYSKTSGNRVYLHFQAANYDTYVYLNGEKLGHHVGGFTPFSFEITDKVKSGSNFVVVKVDNKRLKEGVPTLNTDWWNYGGITREVNIVELPGSHISDLKLSLARHSDVIMGEVTTNEPNSEVTVSIPELKISQKVTTEKSGKANFSIKAKPELWSPDSPKLYAVTATSGSFTYNDKIGFKRAEVIGDKLLLNGKPIFLRGICIHEENPIRGGRANSPEDAAMLLGWAKELGCNYVRLAHYPHNEYMLRKADEMGILVWAEIPVYWTIQWENPETYKNCASQMTDMINRDYNRAAIAIWGVANETPVKESRTQFLGNLAKLAKSLDSTRLVSAALEVHGDDPSVRYIDDPLGEYLDVLGCNEYHGWYDNRMPEEVDNLKWATKYNKPLIISELGADALYNNHGDVHARFTEEYQENFFKHQLVMLKQIKFLTGMSPWILADFRSPRRPLPVIQDFWNRKGLVSEKGQKKMAWKVLNEFYKEKTAISNKAGK
ncbi:MAG: glycoside hydrolase family 2 TIM barrel-domain containing protein [Bacteroidota bacterium]